MTLVPMTLLAVTATSYMEGSQPFIYIYRCAPRGTRTGTLVGCESVVPVPVILSVEQVKSSSPFAYDITGFSHFFVSASVPSSALIVPNPLQGAVV